MILKQQIDTIDITKDNGRFSFLPTGDIYEFTYDDFMINAYQGNCMDGSANNIYLRIYDGETISFYPLLGMNSKSTVSVGANSLVYVGEIDGIYYTVTFRPSEDGIWFWKVDLNGCDKVVDLVYGQDLGMAFKGGVLTNELYMSQYLDHKIIKGPNGYTINSRQNLSQGESFPYLQQGSLDTEIVGFSTDGTQFFGNDYRKTYTPQALKGDLSNENYQFELAYAALQTKKLYLNGATSVVFYGLFQPNQSTAITGLMFQDKLKAAYHQSLVENDMIKAIQKPALKTNLGKPFVSEEFSQKELDVRFPNKNLVEKSQGKTLSFFTPQHSHVVLQDKEVLMERPHGHIITTLLDDKEISYDLVTSTNYMYGIFNAQLVAGNTSFNKLLSAARGFMNILKNPGQRIYIKIDGVYRILTLPAAYEMGMNYAKWYYKIKDDILIVTSFALADSSAIVLHAASENGIPYDFIVTNQLVMGEHEYRQPIKVHVSEEDNRIHITKAEVDLAFDSYPSLNYDIHVVGSQYKVSDDRVFFADLQPKNPSLLTISVDSSSDFQLIMEGHLEQQEILPMDKQILSVEAGKYTDAYKKLFGNFRLQTEGEPSEEIQKLSETIWWYTHNAMVHFAVPHGLEQPGGAAWGTRDICQGPMEFFLTTGHFELAKNVLIKIFEHQYLEAKEWPQYFMFDEFDIQAGDWHGDVVFWPLKCIGDYIIATNDDSILHEKVGYRYLENHKKTTEKETVLDHMKGAIETIIDRFVYNTALVNYAGGDWDDTLQPADPDMKEKLVSAWTVALAYQVLHQSAFVLKNIDPDYSASLYNVCEDIKKSFHDLLIKDDIIAGFAYFRDEDTIDYMLHPMDDKTGIKYRLLPLTRSIIGELVDKEQAAKNVQTIDQHLSFPDGVRLMDRPARYEGGVSRFFQRAEQAANVGREVSLQYVHAHIRYIEAMAKLGKPDEAWNGLFQINPINMNEVVPHAALRQANAYFSSSEGAFKTRYEYQDDFEKLRDGSIPVKGGWRIYSSGSGIYLHQLISNILGIRFEGDGLVIDPVLPENLNGLRFTYSCWGKDVTFVYNFSEQHDELNVVCDDQAIDSKKLVNPYRPAGVRVEKDFIFNKLDKDPVIHVQIPLEWIAAK